MEPTQEPARSNAQVREAAPSDVDSAVSSAAERAEEFARLAPQKKADLLERLTASLTAVSADIVALGCEAKGIARGSKAESEEWFAGPSVAVALARHHTITMRDIAAKGRPRSPGSVKRTASGRVITHLAPMVPGGGIVESGNTFRVVHTPGTKREEVLAGQAEAARFAGEPGTTAVLGAGNVASIPVADVLHTLFVENRTAILKMNPVNAYLREPFDRALAPLIEAGYLRIVDGGADVGAHLVKHPRVTHVHLTGSAETHDRIVWGPPGPAQAERKREGRPVLTKPVSSELGNVSPLLVTPYLYSTREIRAMAEMIATQVANNASFNCNAGKMLVLPRGFPQRRLLLDTLERVLGEVPLRKAYYPGAKDRHAKLTAGREVVNVGRPAADEETLPWSLVLDLDATNAGEPLFSTEPFCSLLSVVEVGSLDPLEFLEQAVTFCNEKLWGTLAASLFVPSLYHDDGVVEHAVQKAALALEYGAVGINVWPAVVYATARAPWGGHPKATLADVQSGIGFVHNPLFLPKVEKTILEASLVALPTPPYLTGHKHGLAAARRLTEYAANPGLGSAFGVVRATLFG
jgi:acyl-CoA reductase-like NAD-dependent aldehyde dehydrogenase